MGCGSRVTEKLHSGEKLRVAKKKIAPRTRGEVLPQLKNERATRCEYIVPRGSENDKDEAVVASAKAENDK